MRSDEVFLKNVEHDLEFVPILLSMVNFGVYLRFIFSSF
jgi:hypothetical protein